MFVPSFGRKISLERVCGVQQPTGLRERNTRSRMGMDIVLGEDANVRESLECLLKEVYCSGKASSGFSYSQFCFVG